MKRLLIILPQIFVATFIFAQYVPSPKPIPSLEGLSLAEKAKVLVDWRIDSSKIGMQVPFFMATKLDGSSFSSDSTKRVLFYNFWFTSCKPCVAEMPMLNKLKAAFDGKVDFYALTFEYDFDIEDFLDEHPFNFTHIRMNRSELEDLGLTHGYPTTVIAVDGVVEYCDHGGVTSSSAHFDESMKYSFKKFSAILSNAIGE